MVDVRELNDAVDHGRDRAEAHMAELEGTYARLLKAGGRAAALNFSQQVITASMVAAVNPWEPPTGDLVDGDALEQDASSAIGPIHRRILKAVSPAADLGISFDVKHPTSQALLAGIGQRLGNLGDAIRTQVNEAVAEGHAEGWSVAQTAKAITAKVDEATPGRATMLARSDLNSLSNGASLSAAQAVGVNSKTWLATNDDRTRETHSEADGQTVPLDQPFTVGGEQAMYPGDPDLSDAEAANCFPSGTLAIVSDAQAGFRRRYDGDLIRVKTNAFHDLAGTPNHPVLTVSGWKALNEIREGDSLVCCSLRENEAAVDPDVQNVPRSVEEIFGAIALVGRSRRIPGLSMQFHGDGRSERDVEVVSANCRLGQRSFPALGDPTREDGFMGRSEPETSLLPQRFPLHLDIRSDAPTSFGISPSGKRASGGEIGLSHSDAHSGTSVATLDTCLSQAQPDSGTTDAVKFGERLFGGAFEVSTAKIVSVDRETFHGDVFNFETTRDSYIVSGIVVHNCRCTLTYSGGLEAAATAEGGEMNDQTLIAAASGDTTLPLSGRDTAWDAAAARKTLEPGDFAKAHFWRDPAGPADEIGSYKFPFAQRVDGKLTAIWRGVTAGAARLSSAKDVDVAAIQKKMSAYYSKAAKQYDDASITPPWANGSHSAETLATLDTETLQRLVADASALLDLRQLSLYGEFTIVAAAGPGEPTRWVAPAIAVENQPTEDRRILMSGSTTWRTPPLPLGIMLDTPHGDLSDAPVAGCIDRLDRIGDVIAAGGYFNDNLDPELAPDLVANALQAIEAIKSRSVTGISVDLMVVDGGMIQESALNTDGEDELPPEVGEELDIAPGYPTSDDPDGDGDIDDPGPPDDSRWLSAVYQGVIGGACIVPVPAIGNASISVVAAGSFERYVITSPLFEDCGCEDTLIAAALPSEEFPVTAPLVPPAEWFEDPKLEKPTPLTITADGRVFGHVAPEGVCHEGFRGRCVLAPRSKMGYRKFMNGETIVEGGDRINVGKITLKAGHAGTRGVSEAAARAHYDNTATIGAFVRAGDDQHGIWVAGALKSTLSPADIRDLMASPLSGDWRDGELIAAHAVIDPGFPVLRASGLGDLFEGEPDQPVSPLAYLRPGVKAAA